MQLLWQAKKKGPIDKRTIVIHLKRQLDSTSTVQYIYKVYKDFYHIHCCQWSAEFHRRSWREGKILRVWHLTSPPRLQFPPLHLQPSYTATQLITKTLHPLYEFMKKIKRFRNADYLICLHVVYIQSTGVYVRHLLESLAGFIVHLGILFNLVRLI